MVVVSHLQRPNLELGVDTIGINVVENSSFGNDLTIENLVKRGIVQGGLEINKKPLNKHGRFGLEINKNMLWNTQIKASKSTNKGLEINK